MSYPWREYLVPWARNLRYCIARIRRGDTKETKHLLWMYKVFLKRVQWAREDRANGRF